jgi:hypothetical protein
MKTFYFRKMLYVLFLLDTACYFQSSVWNKGVNERSSARKLGVAVTSSTALWWLCRKNPRAPAVAPRAAGGCASDADAVLVNCAY